LKQNLSGPVNASLLLLLFGVAPPGSSAGWQAPIRLDSTNGAYPSISWSPQGDLRIFYSVQETLDRMVVRKRLAGATDFGPETLVYNDGRAVAIHYDPQGPLDLAVANAARVVVLRSTDGGEGWEFQRSYAGRSSAALTCYLQPAFTDDGPDLRLIYGYRYADPIFGPRPDVYAALRRAGTWDSEGARVNDGEVRGASEQGDAVCVATSLGVLSSVNNGGSFTVLGRTAPIPEQLAASDMAEGTNGRLYLLHAYTFGPTGQDQHLTFTSSDDGGASWQSPQVPIVTDAAESMHAPRFTVDERRIVAVWQHAVAANEHRQVRSVISHDGGQSWGQIETIVDLAANEALDRNGALDIASREGRVGLVYAVLKDGLRDRVCFMEWTAEPSGDRDADGLADAVETGTGVFVAPDDTGTDPDNPDTDSDAMPDGWEVAHGLHPLMDDASGDLDRDGFENFAEYVAGTDPNRADDFLSLRVCDPRLTPSGPVICWDTHVGRNYRVYANPTLDLQWPAGLVYQVPGDGTPKSYTNATAASGGFFRIEVTFAP